MKKGAHLKKLAVSTIVVLIVLFGLTVAAKATLITYELGGVFSGASPTSPIPWLTASFNDNGGSGSVTLTLTAGLEVSSEFISQVVFNVAPAFDPSDLTITQATGSPTNTGIVNTNQDKQKVDGDAGKGFDVLINFPSANTGARFDNSDVLTFTITGSDITASSFAYLSTGSSPNYVAAHVQGIPLDGGGTTSGFVGTVPIPPAVWLLGSGLLGLIGIRRRLVGIANGKRKMKGDKCNGIRS